MNGFDYRTVPLTGIHRVEAAAGTGKTFSLALLFLRMIISGIPADKILAVTFTNAATDELKSRIRHFLILAREALNHHPIENTEIESLILQSGIDSNSIQSRLRYGLDHFDELSIYTIHSFCYRILRDYPFETQGRFNAELVNDQTGLLEECVHDFFRHWIYPMDSLPAFWIWKKKPDYFVQWVKLWMNHPQAQPGTPFEPGPVHDLLRQLESILDEWRSFDAGSSGEIARQDCRECKGLNRKKYNADKFPIIFAGIGRYLEQGWVTEELIGHLEKISHLTNSESFNKGFTPDCLKTETRQMAELIARVVETCRRVVHKMDQVCLEYVRNQWDHKLAMRGLMTHSESLNILRRTLQDPQSGPRMVDVVRHQYHAALIDEFQDTDPVQAEIFVRLFMDHHPEPRCFLIGDPKQAIYGFRGADLFAYLNLAAHPNITPHVMEVNYRSTPAMIRAVETVFNRHNPFFLDQIPFTQVVPAPFNQNLQIYRHGHAIAPFVLWRLQAEYLPDSMRSPSDPQKIRIHGGIDHYLAESVAREILNLADPSQGFRLDDHPIRYRDIAILVRSSREAELCRSVLETYRIPASLTGTQSVFLSWEAHEFRILMESVIDYLRPEKMKAFLLLDAVADYRHGNVTRSNRSGFSMMAELPENQSLLEELLLSFRSYYQDWIDDGCWRMVSRIMEDYHIRINLLSYPDGERRLTNWLQIAELVQQEESSRHLTPAESLKTLIGWMNREEETQDDQEIRLESDEDAVRIMTIHKSKGLEFPIVFSPFLYHCSDSVKPGWNPFSTCHIQSDQSETPSYQTLICRSDDPMLKSQIRDELRQENLRLIYVAMTRSKFRFYTAWGLFENTDSMTLSYLFGPEDLCDTDLPLAVKLSDQGLFQIETEFLDARQDGERSDHRIPVSANDESLRAEVFDRPIDPYWRITSYSGLAAGRHTQSGETERDRDAEWSIPEISDEVDLISISPERVDFSNFPRGARAGTICHEIFERIDFQNSDHIPIIREVLEQYGLTDPTVDWVPILQSMLSQVLSHPLEGESDRSFCLNDIPQVDRLPEIPFCFPLNRVSPSFFFSGTDSGSDLMGESTGSTASGSANAAAVFQSTRSGHSLTPAGEEGWLEGYIHGFIDLVFRYQGRFYLLDWKSNHLGDHYRDYRPERLRQVMEESGYVLQYHLYTVALDQWLKSRLGRDYNYHDHFGGVYYLFIRGIQPQAGRSLSDIPTGIYYTKPSAEVIQKWAHHLILKD